MKSFGKSGESRVLACVNGPWQAIMLRASWLAAKRAVANVHCALLAPNSSVRFHEMTEVFTRGLLEAEAVEVHGIFEAEERRLDYEGLKQRLRKKFDGIAADEVWISSVLNWREVAIASLFPKAPVFLYEDGLQSSFKFRKEEDERRATWKERFRSMKTEAARILSYNGYRKPQNVFRMQGDRTRIRGRIRQSFGYASSKLFEIGDGHVFIGDENLRSSIDEARSCRGKDAGDGNAPALQDGKTCVFLAQCFAVLKTVTEERECDLYAEILGALSRRGYRILWKEHPRTAGRYFDRIKKKPGMEKVEGFPGIPELPVEIILTQKEWRGVPVVGVISSSMLYLSEAYRMQCYFAGDTYAGRLDKVHQRILDAFAERFPHFASMP